MHFVQVYLFVIITLSLTSAGNCFFSYIRNGVLSVACQWMECCDKQWKDSDFLELERELKYNVFGQDIATEIIVAALKGHLSKRNPRSKALTLSFHGRPGIGKNYVTNFIKNALFSLGSKSHYTIFFSGRLHFPEESQSTEYRRNLIQKIKEAVSACEYAFIIFDEVHKMPPGVLDVIKPFIDHHEEVDGVDYRKSIFIFISNIAGNQIGEKYLELWQDGKKREDLNVEDFENIIKLQAFNEKGGFLHCENIKSDLIDFYIPFLPLEEIHVKKCIQAEFAKRYYSPTEEEIKAVMQTVTYGPEHNPVLASSGCKRLSQKVFTHIEKIYMRKHRKEL